ncbi:Hypothetical protein A7982_06489 [Minicystis rosea]|nr:Hypothetical protein A7982_06489 [Minicystis rosea]
MTRERIKRPEPERTQPIRNWAGAFGTPGAAETPPPGVPFRGPPFQGSPQDPVSRGVEAGYRVIDEYLRQGQAVARAVWSPFIPGFSAGANVPPGSGPSVPPGAGPNMPPFANVPPGMPPWGGGAPVPEEIQQRMGTMIRQATDLAMMWMDFVGMGGLGAAAPKSPHVSPYTGPFGEPPRAPFAGPFTAGEPAPAPVATPAPARATSEPVPERASEQQTMITLAVQSARPVEVSVDVRPRSAGLALTVHALRSTGSDDRRIGGVEITGRADEDQITIRLAVPDDLPPGVYSGLIVDTRSSLPRGTLSVRLVAP